MSDDLIESKNSYYELMKTKYPQMTKILLIIHLLLKNPEGITYDEIIKVTNCTKDSIYSLLKRIRKHKTYDYSIMSINKIVRILVSGNKPTETDIQNNIEEIKNYSRSKARSNNGHTKIRNFEKLISILKNNPNGISTKTIMKNLGLKKNSLYSMIYALREKGFKITTKDGNYIIRHISDLDRVSENKPATIIPNSNNSLLNKNTNNPSLKKYIERIANLPNHDRIDVYDMIKKSIYYQKSAIALIEANEEIVQLNDQVTKGNII